MSFQDTESYLKIKEYASKIINERLKKAQNDLIDRLNTILTNEEIETLNNNNFCALLDKPDITINIRNTTEIKVKNIDHKNRCFAMISGYRRCTHSKVNNKFCNKHKDSNDVISVDDIEKRAEPVSLRNEVTKRNEVTERESSNDFSHICLKSRKGRKNYTIPENLEKDYLEVNMVNINDQIYLQDTKGILYSFDDSVAIVGQRKDDLILWY